MLTQAKGDGEALGEELPPPGVVQMYYFLFYHGYSDEVRELCFREEEMVAAPLRPAAESAAQRCRGSSKLAPLSAPHPRVGGRRQRARSHLFFFRNHFLKRFFYCIFPQPRYFNRDGPKP